MKPYYRKEIDGLRAVAVIPVILFHTYSIPFFEGGYIGVDIFFVISGYLITLLLLNELKEKNSISLKNFYIRRIRRIVPALFFVVVVSIYPAYKLLFPFTFKEFGQSLIGVSMFIPNIIFFVQGGYFAEPESLKPLLHTWSLGIEEQFYFFFPIFLIFLWSFIKRNILTALIIVFLITLIISNDLSDGLFTRGNFFLPIARMWELMAGSIAAYYMIFLNKAELVKGNNFLSLTGFILIILSLLTFNENTPHPSFITFIPVIGTVLLIIFGSEETLIGKFLSNKIIVGMGLISYSLYLWHYPIFVFFRHYKFMFSNNENNFYELSLTTYIFLIIITFLISIISWKFIEKPFRNKKTPLKYLFTFCLSCFFLITIIGYFINKNNGYINRYPLDAVNYLNYNYSQSPSILIDSCRDSFVTKIKNKIMLKKYERKNISNDCRKLGYKSNDPETVLIGDSYTHALLYPLNNHLIEEKKSIYYDVTSCTKLENFMNTSYCKKQFDYLLNNRKIKNIILFYRWSNKFYSLNTHNENYYCGEFKCKNKEEINYYKEKETEIHENFKEIIDILISKGKNVVLLYPLPKIGFDVPKFLATKVLKKENPVAIINYNDYLSQNISTINFFDSLNKNIIRIYPEELFCNNFKKNFCLANHEKEVFYWNKTHLSLDGGKRLLNLINNKIIF